MAERLLANGLPYSKKLSTHVSCVNALAFSSSDGRFLASGGDDLRIELWDFHQEDVETPSRTLYGPRGNIFTLAWSATNRYLYSGGVDETILKYDVSAPSTSPNLSLPIDTYQFHMDSIRDISCHPTQDDIFLSASEDGRVLLHDGRADTHSTRAQGKLELIAEVTGVRYHPRMEHLFATSDSTGSVCLRDARMAFDPTKQRANVGVVQRYNTKLSRKSSDRLSHPETSSITFDREGTKLAVTMLHYFPTIYSLSDPHPLATCSGRNFPNGEPVPTDQRTYLNDCTIKHGSFGSLGLDGDDYYTAGSDDFWAYVWKLPSLNDLSERRTQISADEWASGEFPGVIAFAEDSRQPRYVPVDLSTPFCRLAGHKSIVNTTLVHPHMLHVVTSGVERDILLHSPAASSPCCQNLSLTDTAVRQLPDERSSDDFQTMGILDRTQAHVLNLFDRILQDEGGVDVFAARQWGANTDSSESDSD